MNPLLGRWVSADPLAVHAPGEADLNVYAYVSGQILRAIDPLGLEGEGQAHAETKNSAPPAAADNSYNAGQERLDSAIPVRAEAEVPEGVTLYQFSIHESDKAKLGISSTLVSESEMAAIAGRLPEYSVIFRSEADPNVEAMSQDSAKLMAELEYIQWTQKQLSEALSTTAGIADVVPGLQGVALGLQATSMAVDPDPPAAADSPLLASAVVPGKVGQAVAAAGRTVSRVSDEVADAAKQTTKATAPYKRPSGATTPAQRASVQGKPCVDCGTTTPKQVADHKTPLVKEHYETGSIDRERMRSVDAVQSQCPTCSARQGAEMSRYSREQKKLLDGQ